jgi:hypothetical protein
MGFDAYMGSKKLAAYDTRSANAVRLNYALHAPGREMGYLMEDIMNSRWSGRRFGRRFGRRT